MSSLHSIVSAVIDAPEGMHPEWPQFNTTPIGWGSFLLPTVLSVITDMLSVAPYRHDMIDMLIMTACLLHPIAMKRHVMGSFELAGTCAAQPFCGTAY